MTGDGYVYHAGSEVWEFTSTSTNIGYLERNSGGTATGHVVVYVDGNPAMVIDGHGTHVHGSLDVDGHQLATQVNIANVQAMCVMAKHRIDDVWFILNVALAVIVVASAMYAAWSAWRWHLQSKWEAKQKRPPEGPYR